MPIQLATLAVALLLGVGIRGVCRWAMLRRMRLIQCPENRRPAGVQLDALHSAWTLGSSDFRLSSCTRWPERAGCGQDCLRQIEASPQDCEVRRILARWYEGKKCAGCGTTFAQILWDARKPALLQADKSTMEWEQIPVDRLPEMLQQSAPLCFACHMATRLVREYPDLVVNRGTTHPTRVQRSTQT